MSFQSVDEFMEQYDRDEITVRPGMEDSPDLRRMYHGQMAMVTGCDIAFGWLLDNHDPSLVFVFVAVFLVMMLTTSVAGHFAPNAVRR